MPIAGWLLFPAAAEKQRETPPQSMRLAKERSPSSASAASRWWGVSQGQVLLWEIYFYCTFPRQGCFLGVSHRGASGLGLIPLGWVATDQAVSNAGGAMPEALWKAVL